MAKAYNYWKWGHSPHNKKKSGNGANVTLVVQGLSGEECTSAVYPSD